MKAILCLTFRFIQPYPLFHGRGDAMMPEWPPSPMRAFQALLNAAAMRQRGRELDPHVRWALETIEAIRPQIVAPVAHPASVGYRSYVPHNQADLVSAAWDRGNLEASIASHRMEKDARPMRIAVTDGELPAVHYLYSLELPFDICQKILESVRPCVRAISALGWGIDQVAADAKLIELQELTNLKGELWQSSIGSVCQLRVHRTGSLNALLFRHNQFVNRLAGGRFTPVPPLIEMDVVSYRRSCDAAPRPFAVFKLLDENDDTFRYPHAKFMHIAGMLRHSAIDAMLRNPPPFVKEHAEWVNRVVRGKRDAATVDEHKQFSYVPLPSIGHTHADAMVRNVMVVAPLGMERELDYLSSQLNGIELQPKGAFEEPESDSAPEPSRRVFLEHFTPLRRKFIAERYLGSSTIWHSVTPVILDGHNKRSKSDKPETIARETEKLIRKALIRAGIEMRCEFTWQATPFLRNCLSAHKYDREGRRTGYYRPSRLDGLTAVHVRLTFEHPVPGPLAIGAGRHCGFGLMASVESK